MPRPNYAPMGARLLKDGEPVPFNTTISQPNKEARGTWYVDEGRVILVAADDPNAWTNPPQLVVDELADALKKRVLATSGLSPSEFARTAFSVDRTTRPALYLPAPAKASFSVSLPAKAKLRFGLETLD
jgi:hypothetical protein